MVPRWTYRYPHLYRFGLDTEERKVAKNSDCVLTFSMRCSINSQCYFEVKITRPDQTSVKNEICASQCQTNGGHAISKLYVAVQNIN